jgi:hypothetical protein
VVIDGMLIIGQNPAFSEAAAGELLKPFLTKKLHTQQS